MKTIYKIKIAKVISFFLLKFFKFKQFKTVHRKDINFKLDLKQGIDLSIFIFGSFQKKIVDVLTKIVLRDKVNTNFSILDIGSNIGDKSLSLTRNLLTITNVPANVLRV